MGGGRRPHGTILDESQTITAPSIEHVPDGTGVIHPNPDDPDDPNNTQSPTTPTTTTHTSHRNSSDPLHTTSGHTIDFAPPSPRVTLKPVTKREVYYTRTAATGDGVEAVGTCITGSHSLIGACMIKWCFLVPSHRLRICSTSCVYPTAATSEIGY